MSALGTHAIDYLLGLRGLVRLRWIAVGVLVGVCLLSTLWLGIQLPLGIIAACIGVVVLSNVWLASRPRQVMRVESFALPTILAMDIMLLTVMLYFAGGANNPFTLLYLLHVTLAVMLLPAWGAWGGVALCTAGFWVLLHSDHGLESSRIDTCCDDIDAHLKGLVFGLVVTGSGIAYFVRRLTLGLRASRQMIAAARAEGERARQSLEVGNLAAVVAHELATPLGTIAVVSQDLERFAEGCGRRGSHCAEDAAVIRQEVERCRRIIENLSVSRQDADEVSVPIEWDTFEDCLKEFLPEQIHGRLKVRFSSSEPRLVVPRNRLHHALAILIKNAVEASPPQAPVVLSVENESGFCVFRVMDRGSGFPPGLAERVGEPWISTKGDAGGLGLGLYLVKSFVVKYGGNLDVEARAGGGTTVAVSLPVGRVHS